MGRVPISDICVFVIFYRAISKNKIISTFGKSAI